MNTFGAQMDRKWAGIDRKLTESARPSFRPSQTLLLPPWQTLCGDLQAQGDFSVLKNG